MSTETIDTITPKNGGAFPVVAQEHVAGGYQVFATVSARNAFPVERLIVGMLCYVIADDDEFRLSSVSPVTWTPIGGSGGGAVDSVNGQTGVVVLNAAHVGALALADAHVGHETIESDTFDVNFATQALKKRATSASVTIDVVNQAAGLDASVTIENTGASPIGVTVVALVQWLTEQPTTLAAGAVGVLALKCDGATEAEITAAWIDEA